MNVSKTDTTTKKYILNLYEMILN